METAGLQVPSGNDVSLRPVWLSTETASRPRRPPQAHPDHRGSQETPGAREFLPWLPALSSGPRNPATPVRSVAGAPPSLSSAPERRPLERRRHPSGRGAEARGPGGRWESGWSQAEMLPRLPTWAVSQHAAHLGANPGWVGSPSLLEALEPELAELSLGGTEGQPGPGCWPEIHSGIFLAGLQGSYCLSSRSFQYTPIWQSRLF